VSDELYASVYSQGKNPTAPTAYEAGCAIEPPLYAVEKRKISCPCRKSNPGLPIYSPPPYRLSNPGSSTYCYSICFILVRHTNNIKKITQFRSIVTLDGIVLSSWYCYSFQYLTRLCQMEIVHYECPMTGVWNCMANIADGYVPLKAFCFLFVCTNENQCLFLTGKYLRCLALRFL
jgi:hypothetical protein